MSRLTVLRALETVLETEFDRVYVYPDDYSTVIYNSVTELLTLPALALEELPASENNTIIQAADWVDVQWTISLYGYMAAGEMPL